MRLSIIQIPKDYSDGWSGNFLDWSYMFAQFQLDDLHNITQLTTKPLLLIRDHLDKVLILEKQM